MTEIAPAILTNDISDFRLKYSKLLPLSHYFKKLHVDFADGRFVPTKTIVPADLTFLKSSQITLVAHLMVFNPQSFFEDCKAAGFTWVLFHYEAFENDVDIQKTINRAEELGLKAGLVINPETELTKIAKFIYRVKWIQVMGIHPGAQGREIMSETFKRVSELRELSKSVIISVDGGVKVGIARKLALAGADILVAGSAIVRSEDEEMAIESLKLDVET